MKKLEDNTEIEGFEDPRPLVDFEESKEPEEEEVTELSSSELKEFQSLLTIGRVTKEVDVLGHPVVLNSMTVSDELMVGLETKDYKQSEAFARAYQSAVVAATVSTIDGEQLYIPLSPNESSHEVFKKRLEKVHSMYPIVVSEIYRRYLDVEREFAELAKKLGKL